VILIKVLNKFHKHRLIFYKISYTGSAANFRFKVKRVKLPRWLVKKF